MLGQVIISLIINIFLAKIFFFFFLSLPSYSSFITSQNNTNNTFNAITSIAMSYLLCTRTYVDADLRQWLR